MAGHSKWKNIQHRKGRQDAKRSKDFTRAAKEIIIAAKEGGDPEYNARLRSAIAFAKNVNLPKDKIESAIRKGTGEESGGDIFEITYEGYGPGGVAVLVEVATDNKNRTVAEIRHIFSKHGGSLGETGCVGWMFDKKGLFVFDKPNNSEEELLEIGLEVGVEDIVDEGDTYEVFCQAADFYNVRQAFEKANKNPTESSLSMIPQNTINVDEEAGQKLLRMIDAFEDNDDVQNVHANFDLSDDILSKMD